MFSLSPIIYKILSTSFDHSECSTSPNEIPERIHEHSQYPFRLCHTTRIQVNDLPVKFHHQVSSFGCKIIDKTVYKCELLSSHEN